MKKHYIQGKTPIVIDEAIRLIGINKPVCIVCSQEQQKNILKKKPDFINKVEFKTL